MTLTSIATPRWISYTVPTHPGDTLTDAIGLHRRCRIMTTNSFLPFSLYSSPDRTTTCWPFPDDARCRGDRGDDARTFCALWRTTGFLLNLAAGAELAALVGFLVVMAGGRAKRLIGWKILGLILGAVAAAQLVGMALVVSSSPSPFEDDEADAGAKSYIFDYDDMFLVPGYRLDSSWYLCTFSAAVAWLAAVGLALAAFVLPPEDGYQLLVGRGGD